MSIRNFIMEAYKSSHNKYSELYKLLGSRMTSKLTLTRTKRNKIVTLGELRDAKGELVCYTLENPWKDNKPNVSCIPEGSYDVKPYTSGKFPATVEVKRVFQRTHILFHAGNTTKDTKGCILVGSAVDGNRLICSRVALAKLFRLHSHDFILTIK